MPPQVNATVTRVTGATAATGGREDWTQAMAGATGPAGEPAGAGAQKWAGTVSAFLEETAARSFVTGSDDVLERRRLHIDTADFRTMNLDTNDVVTFTGPDGVERTATANAIAVAALPGIPREFQTTTLDLRAA